MPITETKRLQPNLPDILAREQDCRAALARTREQITDVEQRLQVNAHRRRWLLSAAGFLVGAPALAKAASPAAGDASGLAGKWTYRSFHNRPALVDGDPQKALRLIFAEAVFTFVIDGTSLKGGLDWQGGGLDLQGTIQPASGTAPLSVAIVGSGRPQTDTPTAGNTITAPIWRTNGPTASVRYRH